METIKGAAKLVTINFFEPAAAPKPRDQVKIELLDAQVYADRWRVKININVTAFLERPNVAVALVRDFDHEPRVMGEMDIIETMHPKMEFTMHIRGVDDPAGDYTLKARLYYEQDIATAYDQRELSFKVPQETAQNAE
jgi:hypothetical protein